VILAEIRTKISATPLTGRKITDRFYIERFLTVAEIVHRTPVKIDRSALEEATYFRFGARDEEIVG
jgi:hypothetical protein